MTRITKIDIQKMRDRGADAEAIAEAEVRLVRQGRADELIAEIDRAFDGLVLGDGVGLWQAQGIDDYEDEETCAAMRQRDEKHDWRAISSKDLNRCFSSLSFFDAEGFRFHIPAYLCAELRGEYENEILFSLICFRHLRYSRYKLLSGLQRSAVRAYLIFERDNPFDDFDRPEIEKALSRYWTEDSCKG